MSCTIRYALFCLLALGGSAMNASADDACAADRDRLCHDAKGPAKMQCMKAHEAELSPACQGQRGAIKQSADEVHNDCKSDAQRLCQGVRPGGGRIRACLTSHAAELSPACKQAEDKLQTLKETIHPGCHSDVQRLCSGIAPGGGRIMACLQTHPNELSPACKDHVEKRLNRGAAPPPPAGAPAPAPSR